MYSGYSSFFFQLRCWCWCLLLLLHQESSFKGLQLRPFCFVLFLVEFIRFISSSTSSGWIQSLKFVFFSSLQSNSLHRWVFCLFLYFTNDDEYRKSSRKFFSFRFVLFCSNLNKHQITVNSCQTSVKSFVVVVYGDPDEREKNIRKR